VRLNGSFSKKSFSAIGSIGKSGKNETASLSLYSLSGVRPAFFLSHNKTSVKAENAVKIQFSTDFDFWNTHYNITPFYEAKKRDFSYSTNELNELRTLGTRFFFIKWGASVFGSFAKNEEETKKEINISKQFIFALLRYRIEANKNFDATTITASVKRFKWASISASTFSKNFTNGKTDNGFSIQISGSIGRNGFSARPQRSTTALRVFACEDLNYDSICQSDEPKLKDVTVLRRGKRYSTPELIEYLFPGQEVELQIASEDEMKPVFKTVSVRLNKARNALNEVALPMQKMIEVDGYIKGFKDNVPVFLIDENGKVLQETVTKFGGFYHFSTTHKNTTIRVGKKKTSIR